MFKKHWEKYPSCVIVFYYLRCILLCGIYFSLDLNVHCGDVLVDQLLNLVWSPSFVNLSGLILVLCLRLRFLSFWVGVLILRLGTSEFSAICFYDWFSIDIFSYYLLESLIVIIALPETLCVSLEICYLSSVWNNAYERLFHKLFFGFLNWLFCQ